MQPTEREGWLELLTHGAIELVGRMPWSSNATFLVALELDGVAGQGIYKPERGERPLSDFPPNIYRREVAAYELSAALGFAAIPETVVRTEAPYGEGSIQRFIDADFEQHYFTLIEHDEFDAQLRLLAGLDLFMNNADRKGGHVLRSANDEIYGIDNGLCFHTYPKLRTVMWDYAGDPVPAAIEEAGAALASSIPDRVCALLAPVEIAALSSRALDVATSPIFPSPDSDYRAYPWPLV